MNLHKFRLNNDSELDTLREELGEKYLLVRDSVYRLIDTIPKNTWYDFTKSIHESNLEAFIKIVCHWINTHRKINDDVEFNETYTNIRRVTWDDTKYFTPNKNETK